MRLSFLANRFILVLLLLIFFFECFLSILFKSPTWDEPIRLRDALMVLKHFNWEETPSLLTQPPLPYYIFGLPYAFFYKFFSNYVLHTYTVFGEKIAIYPIDIHFLVARVPIIFIGIILGIYVYRWAKELFGGGAGLISLFIYVFSPNILSHSRLITHDICLTCFIFISVYYFWRFTRSLRRKDLFFTGLSLGLALLSKWTALLLIPGYVIIFLICTIAGRDASVKFGSNRKYLAGIILIFLIAGFTVWAGYGFRSRRLIEFSTLQRHGFPIPAGQYLNGIRINFYHSKVIPRKFFLMGEVSRDTWWYFYIVGFLTKVPVPVLILLCSAVLDLRRRGFMNLRDKAFLLTPVLLIFSYISLFVPLNRGLRYVLPVFPFLFVFIGGSISQEVKKKFGSVALTFLGIWYLCSSIRIFPHYLSYFNEFSGGPDKGYRYLVDSDLDWGQDLKSLKLYMEKKNIDSIKLDYFGRVNPSDYQIAHEKLEGIPSSGYIAVSATKLQNVYSDTPDYSSLRALEPVDRVGYSIFIYRLQDE